MHRTSGVALQLFSATLGSWPTSRAAYMIQLKHGTSERAEPREKAAGQRPHPGQTAPIELIASGPTRHGPTRFGGKTSRDAAGPGHGTVL